MNENLTQDEIDTLLHGVDSGAVDTTPDALMDAEVSAYDLVSSNRGINNRMPALDMVNERFVRNMRVSFFNMLRRTTEISLVGVTTQNYSEYVKTLKAPANINKISIKPLRGTGLFVIDPKLVFATVDNYFGGDGRYQGSIEGRDFTPTEMRIIQLILKIAFADLQKAWEPVTKLEFGYIGSESNPQFINVINPTEVVVITRFKIELGAGGGEFQLVVPFSMFDPIRELLDNGAPVTEENPDPRWRRALTDEMKSATVKLQSFMGHTRLSLGDVLNLNPGDVIPVKLPELVTVRAANIPIFRGALGISNGKNAISYVEPIPRPDYSQD